jgi:DNA polymerase III sliding clamp (beta) subunit (PCNA family)
MAVISQKSLKNLTNILIKEKQNKLFFVGADNTYGIGNKIRAKYTKPL